MNDIATQNPIIKGTVWHDKRPVQKHRCLLTAKVKRIIIAITVENSIFKLAYISMISLEILLDDRSISKVCTIISV